MDTQTENTSTHAEAIIRAEWPRLKRFFRTKVGDADAYDLTQATLLAFLENGGAMREQPPAYLWGIARRQVIRFYSQRRTGEPFDSSIHCVGRRSGGSSQIHRRRAVLDALAQLPLDLQIAIELRTVEGCSLEEVAATLEVSLATAKRYLARAVTELRKRLEGNDNSNPGAPVEQAIRNAYSDD